MLRFPWPPTLAGLFSASIFSFLMSLNPVLAQEAFFVDATGSDYTYYSLQKNRPVPQAVSDTGGWDLAFKGSEIRVNGAAQYVDVAFDSLMTAPEDGYATDTPDEPALPVSSGKGWFNYNPMTHVVTPVENRTIVLKRTDGGYVKIEITDYYRQEFTDDGPRPLPRYYSFRFELSESGSW